METSGKRKWSTDWAKWNKRLRTSRIWLISLCFFLRRRFCPKFGGRRSAVLRKNKLIIVSVVAFIFFCIAKTLSGMWYSGTVTATGTITENEELIVVHMSDSKVQEIWLRLTKDGDIFFKGSKYTLRMKVSETEFSEFVLPVPEFIPFSLGPPLAQDELVVRPTESPNSLRKQIEVISSKLTDYGNALIALVTFILFMLVIRMLPSLKRYIQESRFMQLPCCSSFNIYASLISLEIKRDTHDTNDNGFNEHRSNVAESVASSGPDVTLDMTGSNIEEPEEHNCEIYDCSGITEDETGYKQGNYRDASSAVYNMSLNQRETSSVINNSSRSHRDSSSAIYDCLGATEERYQRLQPPTADEHVYARPIPRVMRDILAEMPQGMTVEDILRACANDRWTQSESDDEDPEENSYYLKGQT